MRRFMIALAAALLAPAVAFADDITFTVPVNVENMSAAHFARVRCDVLRLQPFAVSILTSVPYADVPLRDGAYHGTVSLTATLAPGRTVVNATGGYKCWLDYGATGPSAGATDADINAAYTRESGQAVASSHLFVTGEVPR